MAYLQVYEPHLADDRRAAKIAFYSANEFRKPVTPQVLMQDFGLPPPPARKAPETLADVPAILAAIGHEMPEHIRQRFEH